MKRNCLFTFLFTLALFCAPAVNASSCSYEEQAKLNSSVANIKVSYEEKAGVVDTSLYECQPEDPECQSEYNYFEISVLNMTEDFYIEITNNVDDTKEIYTYEDAVDGIIRFDWDGIMKITTFTIDVLSSSSTNCPRDNYRTIYLTTPRKNIYHYYGQCQENPDFYMCDKYVTFEEMDFYEFVKNVEDYVEQQAIENEEEQNNSFSDKVANLLKDNLVLIVSIGSALILITIIGVVIIKKKRKKSVLWKIN